jgi:hypothetical protein
MTYAFIWFDDTFRFHERFGLWFSENVTLPVVFGLRLTDIGELAAWGMAGTLLLAVYVWSFRQKHTLNAPSCAAFALCLLVLAAFGAGVDMIRVLAGDEQAGSILALLEDGGEMVAIALSAALAITVTGMIARTHAATE